MTERRIDHIVTALDGSHPNEDKTNLCPACGGDPTIATGKAAIGTAGCCCDEFGKGMRVPPEFAEMFRAAQRSPLPPPRCNVAGCGCATEHRAWATVCDRCGVRLDPVQDDGSTICGECFAEAVARPGRAL